ncbi:MAG: glycosyltransferase [Steroidobacteraceae bacterium]
MPKPRVSTTVISFNQRQYLEECLDSLLIQTFGDHEIIIRDDASTDGSQDIIRRYAAKYPRLIRAFYADKNGGLGTNRDACQRATTGDFVAWLDADDVARPNRLAEQADFLAQHTECSLVYCNMTVARDAVHSNELVYGAHRPPLTGDYKTLLMHENFIISSALMFRASALTSRGYHQPAGPTYSDWHFFARLARQGRIGYVDKILGVYRRHDRSATATASRVDSGVRKRREQALLSMEKEFKEDPALMRYCLARFYSSQLAGAVKERKARVLVNAALKLVRRPGHAAQAIADRRNGRYLLRGFEHQRG